MEEKQTKLTIIFIEGGNIDTIDAYTEELPLFATGWKTKEECLESIVNLYKFYKRNENKS